MKTGHIKLLAACLVCTACNIAAAQKAPLSSLPIVNTTPIQLRFVNTDVSDVLQAISVQAHANIVFPAQLKKPISINVAADNIKSALSFVAAAGGLAFRLAGSTYVVAPPDALRQALEPFGDQTSVGLKTIAADAAVKLVEGAFPYLTARPAGSRLMLIGAGEDIAKALALIEEQDVPLSSDPMVSEVTPVQYTSASQLATMLKSLYPTVKSEAIGQADKKGGAIGLAGPRSAVNGAKQAILLADLPVGPQDPGAIYRVYPIKYSSAPALQRFMAVAAPGVVSIIGPDTFAPVAPSFNPITGANLGASGGSGGGSSSGTSSSSGGSSGGGGGSSGGASGSGGGGSSSSSSSTSGTSNGTDSASRSKFLVLRGLPADLDTAITLLEQVDIAPKQVMIEVKVVDTSPEQTEALGLAYSYGPLGLYELPSGSAVTISPPGSTTLTTQPKQLGYFSRLPLAVNAQINALITSSESKILANPRIQVLDNDDANIFIGDTIRTQVSQSGLTGTTVQVLEFPVGIILLVRPRVNADGRITLKVHPVVSIVTSLGTDDIPQTSSREAETTVMIQDGETMVIGGLISDQMTKEVDSVPFLSKLPIVGELFKNRSKDHRHSEIMVFITPHILK